MDRYLDVSKEERDAILAAQQRIIEERYSLNMEVKLYEELYLRTMKRGRE